MITLKELLQLNETVTLLKLYVRQPDGYLIRRSIIGQPYKLTRVQEDDVEKGKLEYIDADINRLGLTLIKDRTVAGDNLINYIRRTELIGSDTRRIPAELKDRKAVIELSDGSLSRI